MFWWMQLAAILGFLSFGGISYWTWTEAEAQKNFVPVEATILESRVHQFLKSSTSSSRSSTSTTHYEARVRYTYEIEGEQYESDAIGFLSGSSSDPSGARETVARYPNGATVEAYVDPQDHSDAVLELGIAPWFTAAFAGAAILWLGIWETIAWVIRRKSRPAPSDSGVH